MLVIPAIDLMDGKVVRLSKGDFATQTVYSADPADMARRFQSAGAERVHVVDLDGARAGRPVNLDAVCAIAAAGVEVVASGGVASLEDVRACKRAGVHGVIMGKALYENRIDLAEAIRLAK